MYLTEGTRIAEKYTIQARIGIGGMGEVYRARQDSLDRMVAVKFLKGFEKDSESYTRFKREAQILLRVRRMAGRAVHDHGMCGWEGPASGVAK
jgi:eukaryotic-like serine/threonine-protein kinase